MFKISHEVPLCLLEDSIKFCDYDYALVHLLDQDKDYANYFLKAKQQGRYIILDNSLHEIGESYHDSGLFYWINKLQPQEFIIPDVWQNTNASIRNARKWSQMQLPDGVEKVAVVQAENLTGASICYQTYKDLGYKKIAFSYGADYYKQLVNHPNPYIAQALGRIHVISNLYERKIIQSTDRIHLLGTACPFEFALYKDMPFIETIDTSNPIMATLDGIRYNHLGIHDKPKANMNDHFYTTEIDYELLDYNIETFKKLTI